MANWVRIGGGGWECEWEWSEETRESWTEGIDVCWRSWGSVVNVGAPERGIFCCCCCCCWWYGSAVGYEAVPGLCGIEP